MAYKRVDNKTFPFFVTVSDFTNPTFLAYQSIEYSDSETNIIFPLLSVYILMQS
jgi:hypothetical protein